MRMKLSSVFLWTERDLRKDFQLPTNGVNGRDLEGSWNFSPTMHLLL